MRVTSSTVKNKLPDKPNEDNIWVDIGENVFLVVDGVSRDREDGVYPNPSPSVALTEAFVNFCKLRYDSKSNLKTLFQKANKEIEQINKGYTGYFKPGLVALIIRIQKSRAEWVSVGDCFGLLFRKTHVKIFNNKQTERLRKSNQKFDSKTIRTEICNNPNHPLAYGVLNGNANADFFMESGEFDIESNDTICIFSDGLEMFVNPKLSNYILENTVENIILLAEQLEIEQGIRTDDKTIIKIQI
ncbi:hypothetical protein PDL71_10880 [Lacibacter sp. MH-610]|jgi:serine/threonine protein phosphatase PrpC|uniref:hypothetical protein n=1 Tax=Chitinophagaceae TaxID=563835 RepID=UPI001ACBD4D3|nr:hypothetical protein [Chitinophagales bacterium]